MGINRLLRPKRIRNLSAIYTTNAIVSSHVLGNQERIGQMDDADSRLGNGSKPVRNLFCRPGSIQLAMPFTRTILQGHWRSLRRAKPESTNCDNW